MEVLANLIRAERLILQDQDKAAVDEIIEEIEEGLRNMEKEIKRGAANTSCVNDNANTKARTTGASLTEGAP